MGDLVGIVAGKNMEGSRFGRNYLHCPDLSRRWHCYRRSLPTNSWDWPTYLVLGFLGILLHNFRRFNWVESADVRSLRRANRHSRCVLVHHIPALLADIGSGYTTLKPWDGSRSNLLSFLSIYGLFLLLIITHLAREMRSWTASWSVERLERMEKWVTPLIFGLIGYIALMALFIWAGYPIAPLVITIILVAGLLSTRQPRPGTPHRTRRSPPPFLHAFCRSGRSRRRHQPDEHGV